MRSQAVDGEEPQDELRATNQSTNNDNGGDEGIDGVLEGTFIRCDCLTWEVRGEVLPCSPMLFFF
jgi:hypothetical protein